MFAQLQKIIGKRIEKDRDVTSFFTLKTKAKARFFFIAQSRKDLIKAKQASIKLAIPFFILGGGSNVAITKTNFPGLIVKNEYKKKKIIEENDNEVVIKVSSGYPVSLLINEMIEKGYSGLEQHSGLPGTVGGAVCMNSKWVHLEFSSFADNIFYSFIINQKGMVKKVSRRYFHFKYGESILRKNGDLLLEIVFKLKKSTPRIMKIKSQQSLDYRKKTQPLGVFSSGCFFRNISEKEMEKNNLPTQSVGYLIDKVGLKGFRVGGFSVSEKHANFILNKENGSSEDLKKLINIIKSKVKDKFNIELKEEVIII